MDEQQSAIKKLTGQQRLWIKAYFDIENELGYESFCNATKSALYAYYPDFPIGKAIKDFTEEESSQYKTAANIGWENLRIRDIPIEDLMDEAGMSDAFLMSQLRQNMKATKLYGKDAIEHPDYSSRNRATELALRVKQKLVDRTDITSKGQQIQSVTNKQVMDEIRGIIENDEPRKPNEPTPGGTSDNGEPSAPVQNDTGENGSDTTSNPVEVQTEG